MNAGMQKCHLETIPLEMMHYVLSFLSGSNFFIVIRVKFIY